MNDINADDAEFGMSDHKTHNELRAEIASLRAELAAERTAFVAQQHVSQTFAEELGKIAYASRAAARQDAEEKARLKELLGKLADAAEHDMKMNQGGDNHEGEPEGSGGWWSTATENAIREARAALACRPQEKPHGEE